MKTFAAIPLPVQGYTVYPIRNSARARQSFAARARAFRRRFPLHPLRAVLINMAGEELASA